MISYSRVPEFWQLIDRHQSFSQFTDKTLLWGDLKEYQRLFILDQLLKEKSAIRILEIGGGQCQVLDALTKKYPGRYECWTLDPMEGQGGGPQADVLTKEIRSRIKLVRDSIGANSKQLPNDYFDVVFSLSVLEHIPMKEWEPAFRDMERVTRRGGKVIHAVDLSVDFPSGREYIEFLSKVQDFSGLRLVEPSMKADQLTIKSDPQTYYVSPAAYMRWLPHFPPGRNTLKDGLFCRVTSLNVMYEKVSP